MKVCVILSGTVREPTKSLETLQLLREAGCELSTFIYTIKNAEGARRQAWSQVEVVEPSDEVLAPYAAEKVLIEDWEEIKPTYEANMARWASYGCKTLTHLGMSSMFRGMELAAGLAGLERPEEVAKYDLALRLRFDMRIFQIQSIFDNQEKGWSVPFGNDFEGVCDRLAWFWCHQDGEMSSEIMAYFSAYSQIDRFIQAGVDHHPEAICMHALRRCKLPVRRPDCQHSIH